MTPSEIADWLDDKSAQKSVSIAYSALSQAAATIRAQVEALKIATEALEEISRQDGEINPSNYDHDDACNLNDRFVESVFMAEKALARIKEG